VAADVAMSVSLHAQVAVLFRVHADLLTEFTYFLPDNSPPQVYSSRLQQQQQQNWEQQGKEGQQQC
jgi:histone deacetylase complex regulatory component SIN3